MAAAQALAETNGMSVNQGFLRDAEGCIKAAVCSHEANDATPCAFWKGHEGDHSYDLVKRAEAGEEAVKLLGALIVSHDLGDDPIVMLAKELINA